MEERGTADREETAEAAGAVEEQQATETEEARETAAQDEAQEAESAGALEGANLDLMLDLPLDVTVELGRTTMQLGDALALQAGSIIELNRLPGEPLDLHVNERLVARGEVVVVNDALALRITEIIGNQPRRS